jgi:cytosine/creatinine deaminase
MIKPIVVKTAVLAITLSLALVARAGRPLAVDDANVNDKGAGHVEAWVARDTSKSNVETLAYETQRLGLHGRVVGSHLTSMHSMDNYYVSKLLPLMADAQLGVVANPLINITLQGRHDSYPKRRGMTRVPELLAHGITVAFGHDCVMDPWYSLGSGDMLEVAHMGLHVAQMTSQAAMRQCFDAVTTSPAKLMHLQGYGLQAGCNADFVLLQAHNTIEALRLRANRLKVWKLGKLLASCRPAMAQLYIDARPGQTNWT